MTSKKTISINLFIEKDTPFLEDVLERINNIKKHNYNIKFNIFNAVSKYNNEHFIKLLDNYKSSLVFPTNHSSIHKIIFEDIEFKCNGANAIIEDNEVKSLYLSEKIYKRLRPIIDDEEDETLKVYVKDDEFMEVKPDVYNKESFLNKNLHHLFHILSDLST